MNRVVIGLGSNVGNALALLEACCKDIASIAVSARFSACYETAAVGTVPAPDYCNCVGIVETDWDYDRLYRCFKEMEKAAGRTPESKHRGEVPLDIDIVVWNDEVKRPRDMEQEYMQIGLNRLKENI
ncbi:MAG: 2-amino-4-hydroxy-6-hydroxymethyldihydropteridine diphosphokinase [Coprobacter sp.]|nr:2-amino-4-hydroxy-6-hydroxymethyldihydropteridine diphosphokinase [Coprobacter sp.]